MDRRQLPRLVPGQGDFRNAWFGHRWLAFGLAGLVGFSRLPLQAHYLSAEFAGAMLGYCIAHYVVRRNAMNSGSRLEERVTRKPTPGTPHAGGNQESD